MSSSKRRSSRPILWLAALALLLRAAVPLFAAGAAQMRGVSVAEVCPIYGVDLAPPGHAAHAGHAHHHHDGGAQHRGHDGAGHGEHCALSVIGPSLLADAQVQHLPRAHTQLAAPRIASLAPMRDASAAWVARLHHGPPARG